MAPDIILYNDEQYSKAAWRLRELLELDPPEGSLESIEFEQLLDAIEAYEKEA